MAIEEKKQLYAIIYNRVSDPKQEKQGSGLLSQEQRCIKYAEAKGYLVSKERIFHDTYTGGGNFMNRKAMREVLDYIDNHPRDNYVVIFDDLKRFARDLIFHFELKSAFSNRRAKLECLNFNFEDTPEGNFVEGVFAGINQLEREQNRRQVIQKTKARLESGYWAFPSPLGYKMQKTNTSNGKIAIPTEKGLFIKEALEKFSNMEFINLQEFILFLKEKKVFGLAHTSRYETSAKYMLRNPFYAGYIEFEQWGISKRGGQHEALITDEIFKRNIERLSTKALLSPIRRDVNFEFEVRGLVNCFDCNHPMTASFCKGRNGKYAYYICQKKSCMMHRKSIPRDFVHSEFKSAIVNLKPGKRTIERFEILFEQCWQEEIINMNKQRNQIENEIKMKEIEVEKYLNLVLNARGDILKAKYEEKIVKLSNEIKELRRFGSQDPTPSKYYRTILDSVMAIAKNPYKAWEKSDLETKKRLFHFFFEGNLLYDLRNRNRTANPSVLYRVFDDLEKKSRDVHLKEILSKQFSDLRDFFAKWNGATNK